MGKKNYDIVYLTNTPSFYKLNLCEKIAEHKSVLLVLYGYGSEAVNTQMECHKWKFDYIFINEGDANRRNKVKTFFSLLSLMRKINVRKILFSGWLAPEYNILSFLSPKSKNVCVCESSILESRFEGLSGWVKKRIINRMSAALPSGTPHDAIFKLIGFKGPRYKTGSVGIFYKPEYKPKKKHMPLRYLYVGRLVDVKNVALLIDTFNKNGKPLTIAGDGPLHKTLESTANDNISFIGFVDNKSLGKVYQSADVFILPSTSETWGLVVEEAIYWGLPVIVSSHVGSGEDLVKSMGTGEVFISGSIESLQQKIDKIEQDYDKYVAAVNRIDFEQRDLEQVQTYLKLFEQ